MTSRKRAAGAPPPVYDERLLRVESALANLTRSGATFASGASDRFPAPAIAFKASQDEDEEDEEELPLPLRRRDALTVKARGAVTQQHEERATAWEVDGALLESRNPKWREFLDEWLTSERETLGISPAAVVDVVLKKMVLAETGARLAMRREGEARGPGVFGSLVVALPGAFSGGDFVVEQPAPLDLEAQDDESDEGEGEGSDAESGGEDQDGDGEEDGGDCEDGEDGDVDADEEHDDDNHIGDDDPGQTGGASPHKDGPDEEVPFTTAVTWQPAARGNSYGITYAAFYNSCEYVSEPVSDGVALCLVYDLVTTTPSEVPLFGGSKCIHQSVASALVNYFDVAPPLMAKRLKIGPDAWQAICEFITPRQFVYAVASPNVKYLNHNERKIFESLAAFCEQSRGQYVLYHASLFCSKYVESDYYPFDDLDQGDADGDVSMTLMAPWTKHGASETLNYPPMTLRHQHEVASSRALERARYNYHAKNSNAAIKELLTKLHGDWKKARLHLTYALVVQPASMETSQMAMLPMRDITDRLQTLLADSRDQALQYAREVVRHHRDWQLRADEMAPFAAFVKIITQINDCGLFTDLLLALHLKHRIRYNTLAAALEHFGWDACARTLTESIRSTPTLRGRVNFITSIFHQGLGAEHMNILLDALLSLHPWTDVTPARHDASDSDVCDSDVDEFSTLLGLIRVISPERILDVVSVPRAQELISLVVPGLIRLTRRNDERTEIRTALLHVWDLFQPMLVEIRNEPYAATRIPEHCPGCAELQAFLLSTATETTIEVPDHLEAEHVMQVVERTAVYPANVEIEQFSDTFVRLVKRPGFIADGLGFDAVVTKKQIREVLFELDELAESEEDSDE